LAFLHVVDLQRLMEHKAGGTGVRPVQ
jgi:hypothetical protein